MADPIIKPDLREQKRRADRLYYKANRAKILKREKDRRKSPEFCAQKLAYIRAYMAAPENAELHRERARQKRQALKIARESGDPDGIYSASLSREKAILRNWRKANPDKYKAQIALRAARERGATGFHTDDDIARIRTQQRDKCAYCGKSLKKKGNIDHIIPISRGGSNEANNIQLTCKSCNSKKNAKDPVSFARECGKLI